MIEFDCPHCDGHIRVKDDSAAGRQGKCQHCGEPVTVPEYVPDEAPVQSVDVSKVSAALTGVSRKKVMMLLVVFVIAAVTDLAISAIRFNRMGATIRDHEAIVEALEKRVVQLEGENKEWKTQVALAQVLDAEARKGGQAAQMIGGNIVAKSIVTDTLVVGTGQFKIMIAGTDDYCRVMLTEGEIGKSVIPLDIVADKKAAKIQFYHNGGTDEHTRGSWGMVRKTGLMMLSHGRVNAPKFAVVTEPNDLTTIFADGKPGSAFELSDPDTGNAFFRQ